MKDVAPSTELRKWFNHRVERWDAFRQKYREELNANPRAWEPILDISRRGTVTLLYSAHDASDLKRWSSHVRASRSGATAETGVDRSPSCCGVAGRGAEADLERLARAVPAPGTRAVAAWRWSCYVGSEP